MNSRQACINGFGALTPEGLVTRSGVIAWESGQSGPADVRRPQVYAKPLPSFGKLTLPDRLAFGAASLMLSDLGAPCDENTGVCLAVPCGSISTDLRYCESVTAATPSPALFSATLPSSSVSEIVIQYKFKGPNRVFAAGDGLDWVWALDEGVRMVSRGTAKTAIVVLVDAVEEQDRPTAHVPGLLRNTPNRALALCLRPLHEKEDCPARLSLEHAERLTTGQNEGGTEYFGTLLSVLTGGCTCGIPVREASLRVLFEPRRGQAWSSWLKS